MNYVAARLLGADADHPTLIKARGTLHKLGLFFLSVTVSLKFTSHRWRGRRPVLG